MVALSAGVASELDSLIEEQGRDARGFRRRPPRERLASDIGRHGLNLDRFPRRPIQSIPLIEGRPHEWAAAEPPGIPCPVCKGSPGEARCLKCTASDWDERIDYAGIKSDGEGPTTYTPEPSGLRGGVGG